MTKPIRVWLEPSGPNPWKVILLLEELDVPYEIASVKFQDMKIKPFVDVNPNGRVPAIEDPNTDLTLWESGAIIQYLIKQYDTENRLSYSTLKEQSLCDQWLMFQMSGQGPYFGQVAWFSFLHPEKIPSAIERYRNETKRVLGVLEGVLAASSEPWLVGDRMTYADLAFVPWNARLNAILAVSPDKTLEGFPAVQAWHEKMTGRPSWVKAMETRERLLEEAGKDKDGMPKDQKSVEDK